MTRFPRMTVLNRILEVGLLPIFYHDDEATARQIVSACAAGGATVVEFTNRGPAAYPVFNELVTFVAAQHPDLILGIGSVVDAPTAALFIAAGAEFVVGPTLNPEVARLCNRRKIAYLPGCGSMSEISNAEALGVEIVKLFPGLAVGGPDFVKAVLGPSPWSRMMPTGGVAATQESIASWFSAGVSCVGMGSQLIRADDIQAGDFASISERTATVLSWIQESRKNTIT